MVGSVSIKFRNFIKLKTAVFLRVLAAIMEF